MNSGLIWTVSAIRRSLEEMANLFLASSKRPGTQQEDDGIALLKLQTLLVREGNVYDAVTTSILNGTFGHYKGADVLNGGAFMRLRR